MDERPIDLHLVELEFPKMVETRVARAEVVERHLYSRIAQCRQNRLRSLDIADQGALRNLDVQARRVEALFGENRQEPARQERIFELRGRNVDCDPDVGGPFFRVAASLTKDERCEICHQAVLLYERNKEIWRNESAYRMFPASECLESAEAVGAKL